MNESNSKEATNRLPLFVLHIECSLSYTTVRNNEYVFLHLDT